MIDTIIHIVIFISGLFCGFGMLALLKANKRRKRIFPRMNNNSWDMVPPPPMRDEKYLEKWKTIRGINP
jgi:hypothetical protein